VVTNTGPSQASGVTISDTLPLSVTSPISSTSALASCSNSTGPIRCTYTSPLSVNSAVTLTITGTVSAVAPNGLVITNTAAVTSTENLIGASSSIATTVTRDVSFAITKTVSSGTIHAGEQITYAVIITNTGASAATNVILTDTLPAGITGIISSTEGLTGVSCSGTTNIACSAPSLSAGAVATLTITGTVDAALAAGTITNTAGVTSQEISTPVVATTGKSISTSVDLRVSIAVTPTSGLLYGHTLTYTVNITNGGPSAAQNTFVTVTLPISVAFAGVVMPPAGFTGPTVNGQQRIWNATSFGVTSTQIVFTGTITGTGVISTSVVITSTAIDSAPADNSASTSNLTVTNQPPLIDLNGGDAGIDYTAIFNEDGGNVAIVNSSALTVTDVDSTHLVSATVTLTNPLNSALEALTVTVGSGISAVYNSATGVLSLTGNASPAAYATVLRTATYTNTSQDPATTTRIIRFVVSDGENLSATATTTLTVISVNDAPILNLQAITTTSYVTGTDNLQIAPSATVTDVDTPILGSGILTVTIRTGGHISDTLVISPTAQITVSSGITVNHNGVAIGAYVPGAGATAQLTVTFTNTATVARVQDLVRTIAFSNTDAPGLVDRIIDFTLSDGAGGVSATQTITVVVDQAGNDKSLLLPEHWLPPSANEEETANSSLYLYLPLIGAQQPLQGSDPPAEPSPVDALIPSEPAGEPEDEDGDQGESPPAADAGAVPEAMLPDRIYLYLPAIQKE
jgi:uncharacterized repeat protein (TIGR01451 family)